MDGVIRPFTGNASPGVVLTSASGTPGALPMKNSVHRIPVSPEKVAAKLSAMDDYLFDLRG